MKIFKLSLLCLLFLSGCSLIRGNTITLHPITPDHIFAIEKGTVIGDKTTTQDGWFLSEYYLDKIAEVTIK